MPRPSDRARTAPMATSLLRSRLPKVPMAAAPRIMKASMPKIGGRPDERRAGGAREADVGQGVARECLAAQHQKVARGAGQDCDDAAGHEGMAHEFVVKHREHDGSLPRRCSPP
ncbi:hypothetical protein CDEF62S_01995 [Castellaniella defragrans]